MIRFKATQIPQRDATEIRYIIPTRFVGVKARRSFCPLQISENRPIRKHDA